ncbi:MAG: tRNA uridine-5-carboxymethylaminomethyl(34) synthesis GTPase MnmE [Proteobacteria bacterium]|nr:tRNA uridine-5-carboxymethylaminomethyl(34) synthesis GTPase MnmE [Pseudomonadota bacterium]
MNTSFKTTIAAISSGQMPAAIGVIRMSGPDSLAIIGKLTHSKPLTPRMMHRRILFDSNAQKLDDALVCYFKAPNSFTGEDSVEIYAHGGLVNLSRILATLCAAGATPAEPGEFSKRAFLNGKIDLSQAEAIMDVIHAQNARQLAEAQRQLSGSVSGSVQKMRAALMHILCAIEATIDFSAEEELAPLPTQQIRDTANALLDQFKRMKRAHEQYRAGGMRTVFIGRPNAGKSSLFNKLLGHDRAIVTDIAGTTTDTIEASVTLQNESFCLIDTAGITQSDNPIEVIGVQRAQQQIRTADIIVLLIDGTEPDTSLLPELRNLLGDSLATLASTGRLLVLRTKSDLPPAPIPAPLKDFLASLHLEMRDISTVAAPSTGLDAFENDLVQAAKRMAAQVENVTLITSQRHISHIDLADAAIRRALDALDSGLPAECIAADLHEAAQNLALITGELASEDILNEIFSHFCIGK